MRSKYIKIGYGSRCLKVDPGTQFGYLTVLREADRIFKTNRWRRRFICQCHCGKEVTVLLAVLRAGRTARCQACPLLVSPLNKFRTKSELSIDQRMASRKHYHSHKEQEKERSRKYKKANPERYRHYEKTRLTRKRNASVLGSHTYQEWVDLKKLYQYTCPLCLRKEPEIKLTKDHVVAISNNGSDSIDNIQPLCLSCNCSKQANTFWFPIPGVEYDPGESNPDNELAFTGITPIEHGA